MRKLQSTRVRVRLAAGLVVIVALVALASFTTTRLSSVAADELAQTEKTTAWATDLAHLRDTIDTQKVESFALLTAPQPQRTALEVSIRQRSQEIDRILYSFRDRAAGYPALASQISELTKVGETVRQMGHLRIMPLLREGKAAEAQALLTGAQQQHFNRLQSLARTVAQGMEVTAMRQTAQATTDTQEAQRLCTLVALAAFIVSALIAVVLIGSIPHQVNVPEAARS